MQKSCEFQKSALSVIQIESEAISNLSKIIDNNFTKACELLLSCKGKIVVTGMGKSGHIAHKIAATLSSTGSPAFFLHAGEANHGDFGMISNNDVVFAISNSGLTPEMLTLIAPIKRQKIPLITLTGNPESKLSQSATINLDIGNYKEACPLGLAPTTSTTSTLVIGDAIAIALLHARGFNETDFAKTHPGGNLGRRLLLRVEDIMLKDDNMPMVKSDTTLSDALIEITEKKLGFAAIVDSNRQIKGIFTDGDLRRTLEQTIDIKNTKMKSVMTLDCKTISPSTLAMDALIQMKQYKINAFMIANEDKILTGVINMHQLLQAGI